jgi:APA family basic amino acid/polyamine antiporter
MSSATQSKPGELLRALGVSHATAIVVGTIIGSGIFLVPAEMMRAVGSAKLVYLAWIVGAVLSFFGALTYAELGAMKPEAGGDYVYVRDGYGPLAGFLYAWTWFLVAKPASIASVTSGIVRVLGTFGPLHGLGTAVVTLPHFTVTYGQLVAIAATLLISALNYIGVRKAGDFQLVFTVLKIVLVLAIVGFGFSYATGTWGHFATSYAGAQGGFAGFMVALIAALWAYDGWNDLNQVAGEVRDPQRSLPVALIAGVGIVAVLYILMNAAVQYVMPAAAVAGSERPASDVMLFALGASGAAVVSAGMALSMLVTLNGTVMSGARIPFAAARDGYFFSALADVHPRFRTPSTSIVVQAVISIVLLLVAGTFQQLFSLAIFAEWLFYMIATSTVFVFRRREPGAERPYKTWGYPVVPALFIAASAVLLYYSFTENLRNSIGGLAVIVAGVPFYFALRRKK